MRLCNSMLKCLASQASHTWTNCTNNQKSFKIDKINTFNYDYISMSFIMFMISVLSHVNQHICMYVYVFFISL